LSRPYSPRTFPSPASFVRINGKIRAREVRVIGVDGKQAGILSLGDALNLARANGVDLVEIAATANPPVCRLVDFGKYRYEQAKKEKESRKHQHASLVKEVQLSPRIDAHDLTVKIGHAVDFLCEDMKVKVTLKFRGREMAHTEFGFQVVRKLLEQIAPFGHQDFEPKLIGKGINVMISPLPRNKRAKNPRQTVDAAGAETPAEDSASSSTPPLVQIERNPAPAQPPAPVPTQGGFSNNPFAEIKAG
jgi:translation initiation factor IF-3